MAQIFKLKRPIFLPIGTPEKPGGYTFYPPGQFGLGYDGFTPNAEKKTLGINLTIRRIDDGEQVAVLKPFAITEQGFETKEVKNQAEIDAAKELRDTLTDGILTLEASLRSLDDEEALVYADMAKAETDKELKQAQKELDKVQVKIKAARKQLKESRDAKAELVIPEKIFGRAFDYATVMAWFDKEGRLLPEAIPAATEIQFMGRRVGDFIETE
jgi:hypothetical protein